MSDLQSRVAAPMSGDVASLEVDSDGTRWAMLPWTQFMQATVLDATEFARTCGNDVAGIRVRVPPTIGRGLIDFTEITPRISVMRFDAEFNGDFVAKISDQRMAKVRVLLSGCLRGVESKITMDGAGAFLETYPGEIASSFVVEGGVPVRLMVLNCDLNFFVEEMRMPVEQLPPVIRRAFDVKRGPPQAEQTRLGLDLLRAANDIMRWCSDYPPPLRRAFLEAKSREIVCSVLRQLMSAGGEGPENLSLSVRDINRIHEARDILSEQFRRPPSILQLARQVGLNQTKLKASFKAIFGLTLHEFTTKCRMDRATELLVSSGLSVAEVAYAVGYDHPANFSIAFKRYAGRSPREVRRGAVSRRHL